MNRSESMSTIGKGILLAVGVVIGIVLIVAILRLLGVDLPAFLA